MVIKINLFPAEIKKRKKQKEHPAGAKRKVNILYIVGALVIVIFITMYVFKRREYNMLEKEMSKIETQMKDFNLLIEKYNQLESEYQNLTNYVETVNKLVEFRIAYPQLMEKLVRLLPKTVWFSQLLSSETSGEIVLQISAYSLDNYGVADFINNLEKDIGFEDIQLKGFSTQKIEGKDIRKFDITCKYIKE